MTSDSVTTSVWLITPYPVSVVVVTSWCEVLCSNSSINDGGNADAGSQVSRSLLESHATCTLVHGGFGSYKIS